MSIAVQIVALILIVTGGMLLLASYRLRQAIRPTGHVAFSDQQFEGMVPHGPLIDPTARLAGQPDGLVRLLAEKQIVPVLVFSEGAPAAPADTLALGAAVLCQLAEVVYDQAVPYALLRYADADVPLEWTGALRQTLEATRQAMLLDASAAVVHRSHQNPAICRACEVRTACDEALE